MNRDTLLQYLQNKRCTVVGLGVSNRPLIDFLLSHGAIVSARDQKSREALGDVADALEKQGVSLFLGENYLDGIDEDVIFRSPGLRPDLPAFKNALENGAVLSSEMELFLELTPATVIGITGSDGKTTTTTLTGRFLEEACKRRGAGKVFVGGNIGTPLLPKVFEMTERDFAVVELSSFQLQTMHRSPAISAVTNVTENHLNWHLGMEEYILAKTNVYRHAPSRMLVTNAENAITKDLSREYANQTVLFSSKKHSREEFDVKADTLTVYEKDGCIVIDDGVPHPMLNVSSIRIPGIHNVENFMTAIALTHEFATSEDYSTVAKDFCGVRHRLELVRVLDGITYYNSSIDSTPARTAAALSALKEKPIVICGGYDKHVSYAPLARSLCERALAVVLTGATAQKIRQELDACPEVAAGLLPIYTEAVFESAINRARSIAKSGDTVLLSPACASFDTFRNFEERGDTFCNIVRSFE
ncbi:MAG: UDP-N-acetylmuramoyl-L-alanine--D-glutamate ligase [Ruminococcaceae bacterium]|nr:UDP-N-acetylmuramoyl-L-alanine--D-glutamate ligase [Oscillospiraceae bacterium]